MASKLDFEIDFEAPRTIFDDVADAISKCMEKESAADIGAKLNRERKTVYALRDGCGFHCDIDLVCGLNRLGYNLKLESLAQDASTPEEPQKRARMTKKFYSELLAAVKEDIPVERDIIEMRNTFEEVSNELNQVACTMEILLSCMYDKDEESNEREALALLWRNILVARDRMVESATNTAVWSAAFKAQKRLNSLGAVLQGGF